jgi:hypothetical protein
MGYQNLMYIVVRDGIYMQDGMLYTYRRIKADMDREKA